MANYRPDRFGTESIDLTADEIQLSGKYTVLFESSRSPNVNDSKGILSLPTLLNLDADWRNLKISRAGQV